MRFGDIDILEQDKIENVKQQQAEIQKVFDSKIVPHENHTLFEVDLNTKEIRLAVFDEQPAIKWEDALKGNISAMKKVTKKENCVYVSALNKKNVIKILKRYFVIIV
jgi:glutamyl/glutaminyl-tRNA synthetase